MLAELAGYANWPRPGASRITIPLQHLPPPGSDARALPNAPIEEGAERCAGDQLDAPLVRVLPGRGREVGGRHGHPRAAPAWTTSPPRRRISGKPTFAPDPCQGLEDFPASPGDTAPSVASRVPPAGVPARWGGGCRLPLALGPTSCRCIGAVRRCPPHRGRRPGPVPPRPGLPRLPPAPTRLPQPAPRPGQLPRPRPQVWTGWTGQIHIFRVCPYKYIPLRFWTS